MFLFCFFLLLFQPGDKEKLCPKSREAHQKVKDEKDKKKKDKINRKEDKRKLFLKHTVRYTDKKTENTLLQVQFEVRGTLTYCTYNKDGQTL